MKSGSERGNEIVGERCTFSGKEKENVRVASRRTHLRIYTSEMIINSVTR